MVDDATGKLVPESISTSAAALKDGGVGGMGVVGGKALSITKEMNTINRLSRIIYHITFT